MGRLKFFSAVLFSIAVLFGCAHPTKSIPRDIASLNASGGMIGIWFLQGTSSTRGPYNGELELRPASDGTFDVIRVVTYINYFYDGLRVQEVWTGKAVAHADTLTVTYELRQGEFVTKLDGVVKTTQELKTPLTVNMRFFPSPTGLTAKFADKKVSEYSEWLTTKRVLESQPLWKDDRFLVSAQGKAIPSTEKQKIRAAQKVLSFGKDPFVQSFKNNPDFKAERPSIVFDRTDLEFYKTNKDIIRLVNKVTDDATISESVLKRNAYFPTLRDKAVRYDDATVAKNFSATNLIVVRKAEQEKKLAPFHQDTNATFTTGMYVASQSMRFQVTKDNQALLNIRRALNGLRNVTNISKGESTIASVVAPVPADQKVPVGWHQGDDTYQNVMWTDANQDEAMLGLLHGLTWAVLTMPASETETWNNLNEILKALAKKDKSFNNLLPSFRSTLNGLLALATNDKETLPAFTSFHPPKKSFYWAGNADWKMEFQNLIETINHLQIANALNQVAASAEWKKYLLEEWQIFAPAQRTLRTFTTYAFANSAGQGQELATAVAIATRTLTEVPYPRSRMNITIDHSGNTNWTISPVPKSYWLVKERTRKSVQTYYQGLHQLPIFELQGFTSPFIWKEDAFQYTGSATSDIEASGVDYLYAYWLARFAGVSDVQ